MDAVLDNPITGERIRVSAQSEDRLELDFTLRPGGFVPVVHVHKHQEERFDIVSGRPHFRLGRKHLTAGPGETIVVPKRRAHLIDNPSDEDVHILITFTPALRTREMFEVICALANQGRLNRKGIPRNPFLGAMLAREFHEEAAPAGLGWSIANVFAPIGAALGRLFGLRLPAS